jgi:hypothetical protein
MWSSAANEICPPGVKLELDSGWAAKYIRRQNKTEVKTNRFDKEK